jgi:hypothetical protein
VRHPQDPSVLVAVADERHWLSESRVREIDHQRAQEAEQAAARQALDRASIEQRIAELERQLAAGQPNAKN